MQVMRQLHVFLAVAAKRAIEDQGSEKEKWRKNACNQDSEKFSSSSAPHLSVVEVVVCTVHRTCSSE